MTDLTTQDRSELSPRSQLYVKIQQAQEQIAKLVPDPDRFARVLWTEAQRNELLLRCTPESLIGSALLTAQLRLEPGPIGHVWLIPRRTGPNHAWECHFMLGYKGIAELAERTGRVASIETHTVYENDRLHVSYGSTPEIDHVDALSLRTERGAPWCWYAIARKTEGPDLVRVLDQSQVEERRHAGDSADSPAWRDFYDAMARKSCVRAMWQQLPMSTGLQIAGTSDGRAIHPSEVPAINAADLDKPINPTAPQDTQQPAGGDGRGDGATAPPEPTLDQQQPTQPAPDPAGGWEPAPPDVVDALEADFADVGLSKKDLWELLHELAAEDGLPRPQSMGSIHPDLYQAASDWLDQHQEPDDG